MKKFFGKVSKSKKDKQISKSGSVNSLGASNESLNSDVITLGGYTVKEKSLSPLHKAAWKGDVSKIKSLAKKDPSPLDKENRTPLHLACARGHVGVVRELLQCKAKLNIADSDKYTPLMRAVECGQLQCVELLLENEADASSRTPDGDAAIHLATRKQYQETVSVLLNAGISVNSRNAGGMTPLHIAVECRNKEMVRMLFEKGAEVDAIDEDGRTSLILACNVGYTDIVSILLDHFGDTLMKDKKGWTAEDYAMMSAHHDCADMIAEFREKHGILSARKERNLDAQFAERSAPQLQIFTEEDPTPEPQGRDNDHLDTWRSESESSQTKKPVLAKLDLRRFVETGEKPDIVYAEDTKTNELVIKSDKDEAEESPSKIPKPGPSVKPKGDAVKDNLSPRSDATDVDDITWRSDSDTSLPCLPRAAEVVQMFNRVTTEVGPEVTTGGPTNLSVDEKDDSEMEESDWDSVLLGEMASPRGKGDTPADTPRDKSSTSNWDSSWAGDSPRKTVPLQRQESDWDSSSMASDQVKGNIASPRDSLLDDFDSPISGIPVKPEFTAVQSETPRGFDLDKEILSPIEEESMGKSGDSPSLSKPGSQQQSKADVRVKFALSKGSEEKSDWDSTVSEDIPQLPHDGKGSPRKDTGLSASVAMETVQHTGELDRAHATSTASEDEELSEWEVEAKARRAARESEKSIAEVTLVETEMHQNRLAAEETAIVKTELQEQESLREKLQLDAGVADNDTTRNSIVTDLGDNHATGFRSSSLAPIPVTKKGKKATAYDSDSTLTDCDHECVGDANDPELTTPLGSYIHGVLGGPNHPDIADSGLLKEMAEEVSGSRPAAPAVEGDSLSYSSTDQEISVTTGNERKASFPMVESETILVGAGTTNSSGTLSRLQSQLKEAGRAVDRERRARAGLEAARRQVEASRDELQGRVESLSLETERLHREREELKQKLQDTEFNFTEEVDKAKSVAVVLEKTKEQLQRTEEEYFKEQEAHQKAELELRNIQIELKSLDINKKKIELERDDLQKALNEERQSRVDNEERVEEQMKLRESLERRLSSSMEVTQSLDDSLKKSRAESMENLTTDLYTTKNELDRTRSRFKDERGKWVEDNLELQRKLDQMEEDVKLNEEALAQASVHYNIQISQLNGENATLKNSLDKEKALKEDLEHELQQLRRRLEELQDELSRAHLYLQNPEQAEQVNWSEWNQKLQIREHELQQLRDNNRDKTLTDKVTNAENRISSVEIELETASKELNERNKQLKGVKQEIEKRSKENAELKTKIEQERSENATMKATIESLEERIRDLLSNTSMLHHHLDTLLQQVGQSETISQTDIHQLTQIRELLKRTSEADPAVTASISTVLSSAATSADFSHMQSRLDTAEKRSQLLQSRLDALQTGHDQAVSKLRQTEEDLHHATMIRSQLESEVGALKGELDSATHHVRLSGEGRPSSAQSGTNLSELIDRLERAEKHSEVTNQRLAEWSKSPPTIDSEELVQVWNTQQQSAPAKEDEHHRLELQATIEGQHKKDEIDRQRRTCEEISKERDKLSAENQRLQLHDNDMRGPSQGHLSAERDRSRLLAAAGLSYEKSGHLSVPVSNGQAGQRAGTPSMLSVHSGISGRPVSVGDGAQTDMLHQKLRAELDRSIAKHMEAGPSMYIPVFTQATKTRSWIRRHHQGNDQWAAQW